MNAWIVLYTVHIKESRLRDTEVYKDRNKIFLDTVNNKNAEKQAKTFFDGLLNDKHIDKERETIYSVNLCEVKNSTEAHYLNI